MRRFILAAVLVAALSFAAVAMAATSVEVTIHKGGPKGAFHGAVKSADNRCVANRKVRLFNQDASPDDKVGATQTGTGGHWQFDAALAGLPSGDYYAEVKGKDIGVNNRCARDRSPTVRYNAP